MVTYNANYWEMYHQTPQKKQSSSRKKEKKKISAAKVQQHNAEKVEVANCFAEEMKDSPSALEKRMQQLLDSWGVDYQFQKVFYIKKKNGKIRKFYIADFFIPSKSLIIETDGAFHQKQIEEDKLRTKDIQKAYPNINVIRWMWHDFDSYIKLKKLYSLAK